MLSAVGAYELTRPVCPIEYGQLYRDSAALFRGTGADEVKADRLALLVTTDAMFFVYKINTEEGPVRDLYRQCVANPEMAENLSRGNWGSYTIAELCVTSIMQVGFDRADKAKAAR